MDFDTSGGCIGLFQIYVIQTFPITPERCKVQKSKCIGKDRCNQFRNSQHAFI